MRARWSRTAALAGAAAVLVVAAGAGGAVAGHEVTSAQIRNNTIKSKDIHNHAIRGKDVHAATIGAGKLTRGARASLKGASGAPGISDYQIVASGDVRVAPGAHAFVTVECPSGTRPLGGGPEGYQDEHVQFASSFPVYNSNGTGYWYIEAFNAGSTVTSVSGAAVCAAVAQQP